MREISTILLVFRKEAQCSSRKRTVAKPDFFLQKTLQTYNLEMLITASVRSEQCVVEVL